MEPAAYRLHHSAPTDPSSVHIGLVSRLTTMPRELLHNIAFFSSSHERALLLPRLDQLARRTMQGIRHPLLLQS